MPPVPLFLLQLGVALAAAAALSLARASLLCGRKDLLREWEKKGRKSAARALRIAENPGTMLSTVRAALVVVAVFTGALLTVPPFVDPLAQAFVTWGMAEATASTAARATIIVAVSLSLLILGEYVPRLVARTAPERWAMVASGPMQVFLSITAGATGWVARMGQIIFNWLGLKPQVEQHVSEEDLRGMLDRGLALGSIKAREKAMVEGVLELDDIEVRSIMTPRTRIVLLDLEAPQEENWRFMAKSGHSHFPVYQGTRDNVVGIASVKALWANSSLTGKARLQDILTHPLFVPGTMKADRLIEEFRKQRQHMTLVLDEFGGLAGLVTLTDLLEEILGRLPERDRRDEPLAIKRAGGSWLIDARMDVEQVRATLGIDELFPAEEDGDYHTLAGLIIHQKQGLPNEGDVFTINAWDFEVIDMDRQRVDKILASRENSGDKQPTLVGHGEASGPHDVR